MSRGNRTNIWNRGKFKDISGERHGRLTAIRRVGQTKKRQSIWLWRCDCGIEREYTNIGPMQISCGCHRRERIALARGSGKMRELSRHEALREVDETNFCSSLCHESFKERVDKKRNGYTPLNTFIAKCKKYNLCISCGDMILEDDYGGERRG